MLGRSPIKWSKRRPGMTIDVDCDAKTQIKQRSTNRNLQETKRLQLCHNASSVKVRSVYNETYAKWSVVA